MFRKVCAPLPEFTHERLDGIQDRRSPLQTVMVTMSLYRGVRFTVTRTTAPLPALSAGETTCRDDRRSPARNTDVGLFPPCRAPCAPAALIARCGGFAPAPGDRRSPLQTVMVTMSLYRGVRFTVTRTTAPLPALPAGETTCRGDRRSPAQSTDVGLFPPCRAPFSTAALITALTH